MCIAPHDLTVVLLTCYHQSSSELRLGVPTTHNQVAAGSTAQFRLLLTDATVNLDIDVTALAGTVALVVSTQHEPVRCCLEAWVLVAVAERACM